MSRTKQDTQQMWQRSKSKVHFSPSLFSFFVNYPLAVNIKGHQQWHEQLNAGWQSTTLGAAGCDSRTCPLHFLFLLYLLLTFALTAPEVRYNEKENPQQAQPHPRTPHMSLHLFLFLLYLLLTCVF